MGARFRELQERLQKETGERSVDAERLGQTLNEAFVADMDDAMREMGVADVRVGERMHQAAGAYFGRLMAYRKATAPDQPAADVALDALAEAIGRNILADSAGPEAARNQAALALAGYARSAAQHLAQLPSESLMAGVVNFPVPDGD